jgi:murein DD-endopeptidase MepM/ murein hydrolase activator NlpD
LLLCSAAALAGPNVYRWVDAQGRVHYGDNAPANAQRVVVPERLADPGALAAIEEVPYGHGTDIYVNNNLAGPLEIRLDMSSSSNVQTLPALPIQQLLGPRQRVLVTRLEYGAGGASYTPRLNLVPGDPRAFPDDKVYSLPLPDDSEWQLGQAFHGGFSHTDEQNLYAVDLIVQPGTPILAARSGVVMQVESAFDKSGLDAKKYAERANLIRILHEDGTMAVYAHLAENGSYVRVGQKVSLGQQIGVSGNTGFSSGPHLHFCLQINTGLRLVSIPFRMVSGRGFLNLPRK